MKIKAFWSYENKMVAVCMLCFGLAMFDRFAITNLSPFIMKDLDITNAKLGELMSVFALSWAFSGLIGSLLSDVIFHKKRVLVIVVLLFSVFSFMTGMARSFAMLAVIRFVMGMFEGPIFPVAQAFSLAQSSPKRRGLNMGLISTTSMGLIANLAGPIVLVALCEAFGWRSTFFLTLIPGLIVSWLIFKVLKEPDMTNIEGISHRAHSLKAATNTFGASIKESLIIFRNRNVRTSMIFSSFIISWNVGTLTFAPVYLVSVKGFNPTEMSFIMAAFGAGAVVWGMLVPGLSDRFGRKPIIIIFSALSIVSPLGLILSPSAIIISICVFVGWSGSGVFALYQAAILGESIDPKYASTAMASVQMTGEIGGCVIGVAVAGILADAYGLQASMIFTACCMVVATLVAFAYYETAPIVLAKREASK